MGVVDVGQGLGAMAGAVASWAAMMMGIVDPHSPGAAPAMTAMLGQGGPGGQPVPACVVPVAGLTPEQAGNAAVIVSVGARSGVPPRAWVVAVTASLGDSGMYNRMEKGKRGALGLFQQRPSERWGSAKDILDPEYATSRFYEALMWVKDWQDRSIPRAAQAVQRSAGSAKYARYEETAVEVVAAATTACNLNADATTDPGPTPTPDAGDDDQGGDQGGASGWVRPVRGMPVSGFRSTMRPRHDGVDIAAKRGTMIRAASAGTVVTVRCNVAGTSTPPTGGPLPCDRDGRPGLGGCGWYVQVRHAGDVVTRYCHMLRQPLVSVGQRVAAGEPLGMVGTSGNSSGPHLHFEVHLGSPANRANATDPRPFMDARGAPL